MDKKKTEEQLREERRHELILATLAAGYMSGYVARNGRMSAEGRGPREDRRRQGKGEGFRRVDTGGDDGRAGDAPLSAVSPRMRVAASVAARSRGVK